MVKKSNTRGPNNLPNPKQPRSKALTADKLRVLVIDAESEAPLTRAALRLVAHDRGGFHFQMGLRVADEYGYAVFPLDAYRGEVFERLLLGVPGDAENQVDVLPFLLERGGHTPFMLRGHDPGFVALDPLPMKPDYQDWLNSPGSIGQTTPIVLGQADCQTLFPNLLVPRFYRFHQLIRDELPINPGAQNSLPRFNTGEVLEYQVTWNLAGHSMGDLVYSVPLAPCESVRLATIEWSRSELASREDSTVATERLTHEQRVDRTIEETVQGAMRSFGLGVGLGFGHGSSANASGNASAEVPIQGIPVNLGGQVGLSVLNQIKAAFGASFGTSKVAQTTVQQISQRLQQASGALRGQRGSVIVQANLSEAQNLQTRVVTNHNKCHTLTVMYYRVEKHFALESEYQGSRAVLLVKYDVRDFDAHYAHCHAPILRSVLLDPSLDECFEALGSVVCGLCGDDGQGGEEPDDGDTSPSNEIHANSVEATIRIGNNQAGIRSQIKLVLELDGGSILEFVFPGESSGFTYRKGRSYTVVGSFSPIPVGDISQVGIEYVNEGTDNKFELFSLVVTYGALEVAGNFRLFQDTSIEQSIYVQGDKNYAPWRRSTDPEIPELPADGAAGDGAELGSDPIDCESILCCTTRLLEHLNCHKLYYNRAIWLHEDPDDRACRFDEDFDEYNYLNKPLMDVIVNEPVAVEGCYVAFPMANADLILDPNVPTEYSIVTLPTRGIFAEALLGQCDACEVVDVTRYRDFECEAAPAFPEFSPSAPVSTNLNQTALPASTIVNVTDPPNLPEGLLANTLESLAASQQAIQASLQSLLDATNTDPTPEDPPDDEEEEGEG